MKKGKIHDNCREEIEIKFDKGQFEQLEKLFLAIGLDVNIKWFRKRLEFDWDGINVCLDFTRGYGYIIELERMSTDAEKEKDYTFLVNKLNSLNIPITSREEFDCAFKNYKDNWKELTK